MITGSIASSLQGEPRATHDIDLVVSIDASAIDALRAAFPPPRFYLDERAAGEAIRTAGMFNVIDTEEGDKIDFWLLTDEPFDRTRFARRQAEDVLEVRIFVSAPEDTILAKLRWAKLSGGSEKHVLDALRIYEVQAGALEIAYLDEWAERLGVAELWRRVQAQAETL
ncbi:hypothetical protein BH24GEM3_BH24GEM3_10500 [soil metagenome]|jgi:hypothetical protein|nr:hypothetical protein [Gemmatimonadota bacterium]